jgi:hypothetical protein
MGERADEILKTHARLLGERANWDAHWQQIAERICPHLADFTTLSASGERRTGKMFDSTGSLALQTFGAALGEMIMPREQRWHGLRTGIQSVDRQPRVQAYFEAVTDELFYMRYSPRANFENQLNEVRISLGAFGTGPLWVDEVLGEGISYRCIHMSEVCIEENHHGFVDRVYRKGRLPAREWARRWPETATRLASVREALAPGGNPDRVLEFVHCIRPRMDRDPERIDWRGMAFESIVVSVTDTDIVREGGYRTMPLLVPRFTASPREPYGRSPAMMALPDLKMANEQKKTMMEAGHRAVKPPLLTADDGILGKLSLRPNAVNVGGLDHRGAELVKPMHFGSDLRFGMELLADTQKLVERAFLVPLFSIYSDTPDRMTATEVMERAKEKGILLRPAAGKIEAELLGPMIEREIDILAAMGRLPPLPPELAEIDGEYRVTYDNPLQRAARSERSAGLMRSLEALGPVAAAIGPEVYAAIDFDAAIAGLLEDQGVPPSWMKSPERRAAEREAEQASAQVGELLQGADVAGRAALSFAKAQEAAGAAGL